jgi:hypothetical protein
MVKLIVQKEKKKTGIKIKIKNPTIIKQNKQKKPTIKKHQAQEQ